MIEIIKVDKAPRGVGTPLIFELALSRGSKLKASVTALVWPAATGRTRLGAAPGLCVQVSPQPVLAQA